MREEHPPPIPSRCLFIFLNFFLKQFMDSTEHDWTVTHEPKHTARKRWRWCGCISTLGCCCRSSCRKPEPAFYLHSACSHGGKKRGRTQEHDGLVKCSRSREISTCDRLRSPFTFGKKKKETLECVFSKDKTTKEEQRFTRMRDRTLHF